MAAEKVLALGVYPEVSLKEARAKQDDARRLIAEGVNPALPASKARSLTGFASENSFEALARGWHQSQLARWSPSHATQ